MSTIKLGEISVTANMQIFMLEDEPFFQKKMIETLKAIGFTGRLVIANNVKEANELIRKANPGLILSDWNLPDGLGIDFVKFVRSNPIFNNVPLLMVTTMDDVDNILQAIAAGADGYVVKPWEIADVIEKVGYAVETRSKT